jgi:hypothetical protein
MTIHPLRHTQTRPPTDESALGSPGERPNAAVAGAGIRKGSLTSAPPANVQRQSGSGVIGCGPITLNAHADAIAKAPNIELEAIADRDELLLTEKYPIGCAQRPPIKTGAIC